MSPSRRSPFALQGWPFRLALMISLTVTAIAAHAQLVQSLVIKYVEANTPYAVAPLSSAQYRDLANALQTGFVESGRTRDGAVRIDLHPALAIDEARAALNRARMIAQVVYADVDGPRAGPDPVIPKNGTAGRLLHRLIIKYRDPALALTGVPSLPLDRVALDRVSATAGQPVAHERIMGGGEHLLRLLRPGSREALEEIARQLEQDPRIEYAQPDDLRFPKMAPNDPLYANQWHLKSSLVEPGAVNLPAAWDITTGSASIFIAIVDTGFLPHPDLAGRVVAGYDMIDDVLVANDGNLRDPDATDSGDWITSAEALVGQYFEGCNVGDSSWHGTHVAGTIGAASNNGLGVTGVNWVSKIVPVRALGKCGGYISDIVDGMRWAAGLSVPGVPPNANIARVINLSLGGSGACSLAEQNAINAITAAGTSVVIAAGNENLDASTSSPGNCNGVITVAAVGRSGQRASYSNFGNKVEIAAPGGSDGQYVLSTLNTGTTVATNIYNYAYYNGTSMATPHVAGIVSLMLSVNPALTPAQVLSIVQTTARAFPVGTVRNCTTALCGAGIIDAYAAVNAASGKPASTSTISSNANPSATGASVTFTASVSGASPTGTVGFRDGAASIANCAAAILGGSGNSRTATCTTASLALGAHSVSAVYSGDVGNQGSSSAPLTQTVSMPSVIALPLYRFNTGGTHFYTISETEKAYVLQSFPAWQLEGVAYYAFGAATTATHAVYRFNTGSYHFYTISDSEKAYVQATFPNWTLEGVAFHTYQSPATGALPVYRFNTGNYHFYTISESERIYVLQTFPSWNFEGIAYYARIGP